VGNAIVPSGLEGQSDRDGWVFWCDRSLKAIPSNLSTDSVVKTPAGGIVRLPINRLGIFIAKNRLSPEGTLKISPQFTRGLTGCRAGRQLSSLVKTLDELTNLGFLFLHDLLRKLQLDRHVAHQATAAIFHINHLSQQPLGHGFSNILAEK
jgi:hypothetical protein